MTSDLIAFLTARLDEDEAMALEIQQRDWRIGNAVDPTQPCHIHTFPRAELVADGLNWLVAEHITRHHPARVLDDVDAKRKAIEACTYFLHDSEAGPDPCAATVLAALALPYADHPDYRDEWRP